MTDNVILQSIIIIILFTGGGVAGAFLMKFVANLANRAKEADTEIAHLRNIQTRIYQVAADSLKAMRLATTLELYKLNYRAFQDAMTDAEVVKLESKGIWRALYVRSVIPVPRSNTLPNEEQKIMLLEAETEIMNTMKELIDDDDSKSKKKKK
jgi:hypothetical protein